MKLKSDRFGMEINTARYLTPHTRRLKSDRFGMEIRFFKIFTYLHTSVKIRPFRYGNNDSPQSTPSLRMLKSDRFGMEITL